jgi:hypothetical protein
MTNPSCCTCFKPKAQLTCGICEDSICKKCTQFVEETAFSFYKNIPADLSHTAYCETCYIQKVHPEILKYNEAMEQAKDIMIFMKTQSKVTKFVKRIEEPLVITECDDEKETIMRLAFLTQQMNYNAIIELEIIPKKVRNGGYQTTVWMGTGIPTNVREEKLIKDRANWSAPNS